MSRYKRGGPARPTRLNLTQGDGRFITCDCALGARRHGGDFPYKSLQEMEREALEHERLRERICTLRSRTWNPWTATRERSDSLDRELRKLSLVELRTRLLEMTDDDVGWERGLRRGGSDGKD